MPEKRSPVSAPLSTSPPASPCARGVQPRSSAGVRGGEEPPGGCWPVGTELEAIVSIGVYMNGKSLEVVLCEEGKELLVYCDRWKKGVLSWGVTLVIKLNLQSSQVQSRVI